VQHKQLKCRFCDAPINKDIKALNKKLINRNHSDDTLVCLKCMAEALDCTVEDLCDKIKEYKQGGCKLFG